MALGEQPWEMGPPQWYARCAEKTLRTPITMSGGGPREQKGGGVGVPQAARCAPVREHPARPVGQGIDFGVSVSGCIGVNSVPEVSLTKTKLRPNSGPQVGAMVGQMPYV